ncbi:MAG: hypothetical protein VX726_13880, partial [Planctomycetota bacterium]|nr:hypothetical protein [Planctomycetota bacterium]
MRSGPQFAFTGVLSAPAGSNTMTRFSCEMLTNARTGVSEKTTSAGSAPVLRVASTRSLSRSTTVTLSPRWFSTQAVDSSKDRTATGS